jgi:methylmalonyl-CoA mutase cobalamin-binding domain/chain
MLEDVQTLILDMAVGDKYEDGEFFLSELIMAGYLASEVANLLKPHLLKTQRAALGTIVMGTVKGDIHDIGKNIVIMMLDAAGFEVIDLGVDVPTERFVEAVQTMKPDVLGISALLTSTIDRVKEVVDALETNGLRDRVKVIAGGRPITRAFIEEIGADGYAEDSVKAIRLVKDLVEDQGVTT